MVVTQIYYKKLFRKYIRKKISKLHTWHKILKKHCQTYYYNRLKFEIKLVRLRIEVR